MFGSIGFPELLLIFVVVLLVFGPKKLPEFAKALGKFVREFKSHVDEAKATIEREIDQADVTKEIRQFERKVRDDLQEAVGPLPPDATHPLLPYPGVDSPKPADPLREPPPPAQPAATTPPPPSGHEEKSG